MHTESMQLMKYFIDKHLNINNELDILDVGSYDINGSYKSLFLNKKWHYTGIDLLAGPNVDIISESEYKFGIKKQYDVVISGNCLEHVEAPWLLIKEIEKTVKKGGLICLITPFSVGEHRYPIDCWRILPDGYKYLLEKESNFKVLGSRINNESPITKIKFFDNRPKLTWIFNLLPDRLKRFFSYKYYPIQDTFVIGIKN